MNLITGTIKGLEGGIKLILKLLIYIFLIFAALSSGWLKLQCDGDEIIKDVKNIALSAQEKINGNGKIKEDSENNYENQELTTGRFAYIKHELRYGETLYDLERKYGIRWQVIKRINKIEDDDVLPVGKIINIPVRISSN